jgi:flagellar protein FlaI
MHKKIAICPDCNTKIQSEDESDEKVKVECPNCDKTGSIVFKPEFKELDFYPLNKPYAYVKIILNMDKFEKKYKVIEPSLTDKEQKYLNFIWENLLKSLNMRLDELDNKKINNYLTEQVEQIIENYEIKLDNLSKNKILYYITRESLGYGKIDAIMRDPHIEDISCDGAGVPIFLYHRKYGSVRSNVKFKDEDELSFFVVLLAQKCGKHISIAEPMLDATMPDGSRIQMTLSDEITTKGSTFTIRKFRADPITPPDLVDLNTLSSEILAYFWLAVENGVNALIAGGTASGKTTILNALSLFIPLEAKIVSIEETREINLPHPNWIPGVARSGFGEIVANRMIGEIDLYDLMKAALRQRPEYILVGD